MTFSDNYLDTYRLAVPYQINPFGFSMQANFVRMRGLTPFAFLCAL